MTDSKYVSAKIYKIVDRGYNMCYFGSTIESLSKRMTRHRRHYTLHQEDRFSRVSVFDIFDEYGVENCKIELVEGFPCSSVEELNRREGFYIQNNACVNKNVAGRTVKEWYQDNKETRAEQARQWKVNNPEKVREINRRSLEKNQEKRAKKAAETLVCAVCGADYTRPHRTRHARSAKHRQALGENELGLLNIMDEDEEEPGQVQGQAKPQLSSPEAARSAGSSA